MDITSWALRKRNYALETSKAQIKLSAASSHPLLGGSAKAIVSDMSDPLNFLRKEKKRVVVEEYAPLPKDDPVEYWNSLSSITSKKFASTEAFKIYSDADDDPKPVPQTFSRLELLEKDNKKKGNEISYLSHKEFLAHINLLTKEMEQAWNQNDRVKTLKLAIQSTKMLRDVQTQTYYPAVFMSITEMLDHFGYLVYTRLIAIAFEGKKDVVNFDSNEVNEQSKETALNWLLKISCIRELQPRLYVEMSLIKNYKFLWDDEHSKVLVRISQQIRGIGSPVMACYAGMYLAKQVISLGIGDKSFLIILLEDLCQCLIGILPEHYELCTPALSWIFYCTALSSSKDELFKLIERLQGVIEYRGDILRIIIEEYPTEYILPNVNYFLDLISGLKNASDRMEISGALAKAYLNSSIDENSMKIINRLWIEISENGKWNIKVYLKASMNFLQLFFKKFGIQQIDILLKDILSHLREDKMKKDWTSHVSEIMNVLISNARDLSMLISLEQFLPLLDEVTPQKKTELCNKIIDTFAREEVKVAISNPLMIHALFTITRVVHDSLDGAESNPDLIARVSNLICKFVRNLHFGNNLEQHLTVLTEARSSFIQFDEVTETLVNSVLDISMKAHKLVSGKHNFKTHAFLKACVSYAHITIPSIDDNMKQFKLFILASQVALVNNLIGEAESLIKTAIARIPDLAEDDELPQVEDCLHTLIGQLVLLPDNPGSSSGFFLPAHGLINALTSLNKRFERLKLRLFISILWYLSSQTQLKLPLKIFRVDSNDKLMSGNANFKEEQLTMMSTVIEELLNFVTECGQMKTIDDAGFEVLLKFYMVLQKVYVCLDESQVSILLKRIYDICLGLRGEAKVKMLRVV
ncbi:hypothetical protein SteCoe_21867 [Stentor coeruleus]|uniref:Uncharacterized protein n=1 Tax=Stentor coeruleus TaxID=5963 RepID=A0A1R2BNF7_9CILI|nr:hypothetical protein SteCoe_21867 [Stentor coeruleus]